MKKLLKKLKLFSSRILSSVLLLAAVLIIYYFFPHQGKFPYEFQRGAPWLHETLIAEFDFPILKKADELSAERDSVLRGHKPYFILDTQIAATQIKAFRANFNLVWENFRNINQRMETSRDSRFTALGTSFEMMSSLILDSVYKIGILPNMDDIEGEVDIDQGLMVIKNNLATSRLPGQCLNEIESYNLLRQALGDSLAVLGYDRFLVNRLFGEVGFNNYLTANLSYDIQTTETIKNGLLEEISTTKGLVQEGQRIILEGDMVTEDKYMVLESFRTEYEKQLGDPRTLFMIRLGQFVLIIVCFAALFLFLRQFRIEILESQLKVSFILLMIVLAILGASLAGRSESLSIYVVPFIILPIVMRSFFDSRSALFIHLITMLLAGFLVPNGFEFYFMQILAGFAAIISFSHLHRRGQLVLTSAIVLGVYAILYVSLAVVHQGTLSGLEWKNLAWMTGNAVLLLFSYPLIYIFEKMFGFISDVTLIELSDSNHPLLRKLAEDAPGTFQHTLQVANLAESVIRVIGGNPLLVRTGAMYHDIGKADNAMFFTENQVTGMNPHDRMDRKQSASVIINHVIRGIELARKHKLPQPVADFIPTHHGTSSTQYFLKMYLKEFPDDPYNLVDFSYPGPKPFSKETAVLMMADSIEAASRSLSDYSEVSLKELVDKVIDYQMSEGQYLEADITFKNISQAKEVFVKKLVNIYHARIQYPK